jgi:hypothetical protein
MRRRMVGAVAIALMAALPAAAHAQVLRVGSYKGIRGQFKTIQAAVDAAKPGDLILVGPGDYKTTTTGSTVTSSSGDFPAGILITTPDLTLRGMNRNTVIVDGTKSGPPCSSSAADQNLGPAVSGGDDGLNGIMVWKADDVSVENMTACNFLDGTAGDGGAGNEFWWNGGADSGAVGGWGYYGGYLTATSTFYANEISAATYGIFSSNWSGGTWDNTYASNFNDSGYYIGACQQICDQTVDHAWAEYNALGYSGSNSGGQLVVENSQFDNNEDGFDTNSQNGDNPPPQNGACPNNGTSPITHTHSCWVFTHNYVHDNNNPNVPTYGSAAAGPVGTGMSISGGRDDTVMDNTFANNDAWGTIFVPYPDSGPPCTGGTQNYPISGICWYDESGDALIGNTYTHNGSFGNPTNGDFAAFNLESDPTDCFSGNMDTGGTLTSSPAGAEQTYPTCNGSNAEDENPTFLDEVACDSGSIDVGPVNGSSTCPPGANYPRQTQVTMRPLPAGLQTMPRVCSGVQANPWCSGEVTRVKACVARSFRVPLSLATRERFVSVTVKVRGRSSKHKAHGHRTSVLVRLGTLRRARVRFVERIRVRGQLERVTFTRIYHSC